MYLEKNRTAYNLKWSMYHLASSRQVILREAMTIYDKLYRGDGLTRFK
jgi:hypothetical protein